MKAEGLSNTAARLFSNPAGDYGSMVNERVGAANWEDGRELGDTWASRNAFSYGRCLTALCWRRAASSFAFRTYDCCTVWQIPQSSTPGSVSLAACLEALMRCICAGRGSERGTARPEVLQGLLKTTDRVVQEIDSVEYGLTDIQEYYANTGALKKAAEMARGALWKAG